MKFLLPNYSCLQNPWLGGYRPQIPVLSILCPQLNLLNPPPPPNKIPGCQKEGMRPKLLTVGASVRRKSESYMLFLEDDLNLSHAALWTYSRVYQHDNSHGSVIAHQSSIFREMSPLIPYISTDVPYFRVCFCSLKRPLDGQYFCRILLPLISTAQYVAPWMTQYCSVIFNFLVGQGE